MSENSPEGIEEFDPLDHPGDIEVQDDGEEVDDVEDA